MVGAAALQELPTLLSREVDTLPEAIRRFVACAGTATPVTAAQHAAASVLEEYYRTVKREWSAISVRALCDLLGVKLRGTIPAVVKRRSLRWLDAKTTEKPSRVAALILTNDQVTVDVDDPHPASARVGVAHELGHVLIHSRGAHLDFETLRQPTSGEEEILSEYIARLLLLPWAEFGSEFRDAPSWALACLEMASRAAVSIHSAAGRLYDPEQTVRAIDSVIYWRCDPRAATHDLIEKRMRPFWHISPGYFIPVRKCHVLGGSLIARVANAAADAWEVGEEDVSIGSFKSKVLVDAFGWGSAEKGTRCVLSIFSKNH